MGEVVRSEREPGHRSGVRHRYESHTQIIENQKKKDSRRQQKREAKDLERDADEESHRNYGGKRTEERWRFSGREEILTKNRHIGKRKEGEVGSDLKREAAESRRKAENQSTYIRRKVRGGAFGERDRVRIQRQAKCQD